MSVGLLGKKVGMTQVFDKQGRAWAATVLEVGPCVVTRLRTPEKDGYTAVQLGYGLQKKSRTTKAMAGQVKRSDGSAPQFTKEIRTPTLEGLEVGKELNCELFRPREYVDVSGVSIGRGFQGVVKRHGFKGGPGSHGAKFGRESGSIGQHTFPGRVLKGTKMAGQMGNVNMTIQNIRVFDVVPEENIVVLRGSVPGPENALLTIRVSLKKGQARKDWLKPEPLPEEVEHHKEEPKAKAKEAKPAADKAAKGKAPAAPKAKK